MKNYKRKYFVYWHSQVSYLLKLGQRVTKSHLSRGFAGRQLQNSAHFFSFLLPQTSSSLGFSCLHFSLTSQLDGGRTDFSSSLLQHSTAPSLSVNLWALRSTTLSPNRHCFSHFLAVFWNLRILACFICESCSERNCSYVIMLAQASEVDVGGTAEPSHQYPVTFCCRETDGSKGTIWQNGIWHGSAYEAKRVPMNFSMQKKKWHRL